MTNTKYFNILLRQELSKKYETHFNTRTKSIIKPKQIVKDGNNSSIHQGVQDSQQKLQLHLTHYSHLQVTRLRLCSRHVRSDHGVLPVAAERTETFTREENTGLTKDLPLWGSQVGSIEDV